MNPNNKKSNNGEERNFLKGLKVSTKSCTINRCDWTLEEIAWISMYHLPYPFGKMLSTDIERIEQEHFKFFGFVRSGEEIHDKWCESR